MAQTNYTPISLYYSTTASAVPTAANLVQGELAINTNDGKLYYEDSSGVVQTLASKAGALGDVVGPASATDNAHARFDLTTGKLIQNSIGILTDAGALSGLTGLTSSGSITLSSLTSGRVTFAGASGLLQDTSTFVFDGTNLGIGTSSPSSFTTFPSKLVVGSGSGGQNITIYSGTTSEGNLIFADGTTGTDQYSGLFRYDHADNSMKFFTNGGNLGINISSSSIVTMPAYGAGAATFSAAGVISSVSDETWKTKDGVPTNPDVMLQKLEPGYWFYNEEKKETFGSDRQLGFYAQNVHEAIGEEAAPTPEKYKDIDGNDTNVSKPWGYYDRSVLAVTVMSLKNALNTIEELKQRITALENK